MDIHSIGGPKGINPQPLGEEPAAKSAKSFTDVLKESLQQVNDLQAGADKAVSDLMQGKQHDLHQTMIAITKADLSFQLMMQVRNKILSAYQEISQMQI